MKRKLNPGGRCHGETDHGQSFRFHQCTTATGTLTQTSISQNQRGYYKSSNATLLEPIVPQKEEADDGKEEGQREKDNNPNTRIVLSFFLKVCTRAGSGLCGWGGWMDGWVFLSYPLSPYHTSLLTALTRYKLS